MNAFYEGYLPLAVALDASGGPERRTEIITLGSGREERNTVWAHGRRRYDIGGGVTTLDMLHAVIAFFEARRGRLQGFRFRDIADCKSCAPTLSPSRTDQALGVAVDGEALIPDAFGVDGATGVVTFADPPTLGLNVTAGFVFDTPVRFDTDRLDARFDGFAAGRVMSVPLIEIVL